MEAAQCNNIFNSYGVGSTALAIGGTAEAKVSTAFGIGGTAFAIYSTAMLKVGTAFAI